MKIDPHASLLAAQNLRTGDAAARGRQASANFFATLKEVNTGTGAVHTPKAAVQTASVDQGAQRQASPVNRLREAPLRPADPANPLPPGSLLNILV